MSERYQRAKDIFLKVCDLDAAQRKGELDRECAGDAALRSEVESLLLHHDAPHDLREAATAAQGASTPHRGAEYIGPYRILHEIGRGGMGVVYLAKREDDKFRRQVALKILKRGMDTDDVLKRFELERQVLAAMNHPNIARLYDGGQTEDGRPYFALEYVEGLSIEEYCDAHRLSIEERLELFRQVCSAVHYAHQNLVVHRDLKPGNILVSKEGVPKLLDFGIAKVINPAFSLFEHDPTIPSRRMLTPEYASPEQMRGNPITTASDIYSLGVILYELLSGHRPYQIDRKLEDEAKRIICEEDPERPSTAVSKVEEITESHEGKPPSTRTLTPETVARTRVGSPNQLRRRLAGDIDNIVLMAMRKEPQRRYKSAEQFSEDIRRHKDGLTVIARPDTFGYRAAKFLQRNRGPVAVAAVIALLLIGGIVATTAMARVADRERKVADAARLSAQQLTNQLLQLSNEFSGDFESAIRRVPGSTPSRKLLIETAERYFDSLIAKVGDDPTLRAYKAQILERRGDLLGSKRSGNTGDTDAALASYDKALVIRQASANESPDDPVALRELAECVIFRADLLDRTGSSDLARTQYDRAATLVAPPAIGSSDPESRRVLAAALYGRGAMALKAKDGSSASADYDRSLVIREELAAVNPDNLRAQRDLSVVLFGIADIKRGKGEPADARNIFLRVIDILTPLSHRDPQNTTYRRDLANAHRYLGMCWNELDESDKAIKSLGKAIEINNQLLEEDPTNARARQDMALIHETIGAVNNSNGDLDEAAASFGAAIITIEPLTRSDESNVLNWKILAFQHRHLGEVCSAQGKKADARQHLETAAQIYRTLSDRNKSNTQFPALLQEVEDLLSQLVAVSQ